MSNLPKEVREAMAEAADLEMSMQTERGEFNYLAVADAALSALGEAGWTPVSKRSLHAAGIFNARVHHLISALDARGTDLYPEFVLPEAIEAVRAMLSASQEQSDV